MHRDERAWGQSAGLCSPARVPAPCWDCPHCTLGPLAESQEGGGEQERGSGWVCHRKMGRASSAPKSACGRGSPQPLQALVLHPDGAWSSSSSF